MFLESFNNLNLSDRLERTWLIEEDDARKEEEEEADQKISLVNVQTKTSEKFCYKNKPVSEDVLFLLTRVFVLWLNLLQVEMLLQNQYQPVMHENNPLLHPILAYGVSPGSN